jgi:hypothetical protein
MYQRFAPSQIIGQQALYVQVVSWLISKKRLQNLPNRRSKDKGGINLASALDSIGFADGNGVFQ